MTLIDDRRTAYLARVASLYYELGKNQQEIAEDLGVSRPAVSRLLSEAREKGIVEITIHYPWRTSPELERRLCQAFQLRRAIVLVREQKSDEDMLVGLGILASHFFQDLLWDGMIIGISWGRALYQLIRALTPRSLLQSEVVQFVGASGNESSPTDGPLLAQLLSSRLGCQCRYLYAPVIVDNAETRQSLLQSRSIRDTLDRASQCHVALVGIGSTAPELSSMQTARYLSVEELREMRRCGAVGDVCAHYYDINGRYLDIEVNRRTISVAREDLAQIDLVIGVGGGEQKADSILGALRGGYVNVLITDDLAAVKVLEQEQ